MAHLENIKSYKNKSQTHKVYEEMGPTQGETTCECGMEQTMKHITQCPIRPYSCTQEYIINVSNNTIDIAHYWAETIYTKEATNITIN